MRGLEQLAGFAGQCRFAGSVCAGEHQRVSGLEQKRLRQTRQRANAGDGRNAVATAAYTAAYNAARRFALYFPEFQAGHEVNRLASFGPGPARFDVCDSQVAPRFACVAKFQRDPGTEFFKKRAGHREDCGGEGGSSLVNFIRGKPYASGSRHAPIFVALGTALYDRGARLDGPRPKLRAWEIHEDLARVSSLLARALQILDHAEPKFGIVVRAIDAHAVHPGLDKLANGLVIRRCLGTHGYHDSNGAPGRRRPEERFGMFFKQLGSCRHADSRSPRARNRCVRSKQLCQHMVYGLNRVENVAFGAAERGEAQPRKLRLQFANIVPAERQVVSQVSGAGAIGFVKRKGTLQE